MRVLALIPLLGLLGCQATHLLYVHNTVAGIDVSVSTEGTSKFVLGFDRETYALVPRKGDGEEAMALVGTSCVHASRFGDRVEIRHVVATGSAAKDLSKSLAKEEHSLAAFVGSTKSVIAGCKE